MRTYEAKFRSKNRLNLPRLDSIFAKKNVFVFGRSEPDFGVSSSYLATLLWRKDDKDIFPQNLLKLRVRIKDNNNSPHRFLFPFSSWFSDLNFPSYVLYIYRCYVTCHTQWAWVTYALTPSIPQFQHGNQSPGGGDSHVKQMEMLVVSLRVVNFEFWSRLGCSKQSANILCRQRSRLRFREETQNYAKRNRSQISWDLW